MVRGATLSRIYRFGVYRFDAVRGRLESPKDVVTLRPRVADLLLALLDAAPEPLSKRELIAKVWQDTHIAASGLARLVNELRAALIEEPSAIETLPKRGYRFTLQVCPEEDLSTPDRSSTAEQEGLEPFPARRTRSLLRILVVASVLIPILLVFGWVHFGPGTTSFPDNPPISAEERERLAQREFQSGYRAWGLWSLEEIDIALEHFHRAAIVGPGLWFGFVGIADAHVARILLSPNAPPFASKWALQAAERGVQFGPDIAAAQCALGSVALIVNWDWEQAELAFNRALSFNAFSYVTYQRRGLLRMLQGRFAEARADLERSLELQPADSDAVVFLGYNEFCARKYERALAVLRKLPDSPGKRREALRIRAASYAMQGRFPEARKALASAAISEMDRLAAQAWIDALRGHTVAADGALATLKSQCYAQDLAWCDTAVPEATLGRTDAAFSNLEAGVRIRHWKLLTVAVDPRLAPLHEDPRWDALLKKIHTPLDGSTTTSAELPDPRFH